MFVCSFWKFFAYRFFYCSSYFCRRYFLPIDWPINPSLLMVLATLQQSLINPFSPWSGTHQSN